jgi:hypothetical protein
VDDAREQEDFSKVKAVGVDETAFPRPYGDVMIVIFGPDSRLN